jgi:hypothetical protein
MYISADIYWGSGWFIEQIMRTCGLPPEELFKPTEILEALT